MTALVVWLVIIVVVLGAGLLTWRLGFERYRTPDPGPSVPTEEVLIDPESGRRQRVYMNPTTGARTYVDEPAPGGPGATA